VPNGTCRASRRRVSATIRRPYNEQKEVNPHISPILALILTTEELEGENDQCRLIGNGVGWRGVKEGGGLHRSSYGMSGFQSF
jgi:hypothetical protein